MPLDTVTVSKCGGSSVGFGVMLGGGQPLTRYIVRYSHYIGAEVPKSVPFSEISIFLHLEKIVFISLISLEK